MSFQTVASQMSQPGATQQVSEQATDKTAIRPFQINIPEEELVDLRRRIEATRFPEKETVEDQSQGPQLATMQALAKYWGAEYDWRKCEAKLKALPNFVTEIDALTSTSSRTLEARRRLPIIITHGWPGSVVEQLKLVEPLTDPTAYRGKPE